MARLRYNGLATTLGAALTNSGTAITFAAALTHSGGTAVPTISGSDYIPLTILTSGGAVSEIVYLTAYTAGATTGTITRAQEATTGVAHAIGDAVIHSPTVTDFASSSVAPLWARKTANESVTSSTTLQDDDHLALTLAANSTYQFEAMLMIYGATAADIKLTFPPLNANWEIYWGPIGPASNIGASDGSAAWFAAWGGSKTLVIGTATLSDPMTVLISGSVTTDATGGPLKLQWAQNASSTTATTIYKGSHLMAQKVA